MLGNFLTDVEESQSDRDMALQADRVNKKNLEQNGMFRRELNLVQHLF